MFLKFIFSASLILSASLATAGAKKNTKEVPLPTFVPDVATFTPDEMETLKKKWNESRKIANKGNSEKKFTENELSSDFIKIRDGFTDEKGKKHIGWLQVENANQMAEVLDDSYTNYSKFSPDTQYFLAQLHILRPLRGIVWRLRPIFEKETGFLGNKATHVSAVQFVRNLATGLSMAFPTSQMNAVVEYMTYPSVKMSSKDQFTSIEKFQEFLVNPYVAALNESIKRTKEIMKENATSIFYWDNKMIYGTGAFNDDINRVVGFGPAEMNLTTAMTYESIHDALVFSAYDQRAILQVAAHLGTAFGIDSIAPDMQLSGFGLTDKERAHVINKFINRSNFLHIRDSKDESNKFGSNLMVKAFEAKINSIDCYVNAYDLLQDKPATTTMVLNPILFQDRVKNRLGEGIKTAQQAMKGIKEIRDPISGDAITINIPEFYGKNRPESLGLLMAQGWEDGPIEKPIQSKSGETLKVRNYFYERSNAWKNNEWKKYVPSAEGKPASYMSMAKRVMYYSLGSSSLFGPIDLFIR